MPKAFPAGQPMGQPAPAMPASEVGPKGGGGKKNLSAFPNRPLEGSEDFFLPTRVFRKVFPKGIQGFVAGNQSAPVCFPAPTVISAIPQPWPHLQSKAKPLKGLLGGEKTLFNKAKPAVAKKSFRKLPPAEQILGIQVEFFGSPALFQGQGFFKVLALALSNLGCHFIGVKG